MVTKLVAATTFVVELLKQNIKLAAVLHQEQPSIGPVKRRSDLKPLPRGGWSLLTIGRPAPHMSYMRVSSKPLARRTQTRGVMRSVKER